MLSLLRLNAIRLDHLILRSRSDAPAPGGEQTYSFVLTHRNVEPGDPEVEHALQLRIRLRPDAPGDSPPAIQDMDVSLTGYFSFAERASEENRAKIYPLTAVAMLFGVARGIVAQATALFPTGTFMLPPLDVTSAAKKKRISGTCKLVTSPIRSDQRTAAVSEPVGRS